MGDPGKEERSNVFATHRGQTAGKEAPDCPERPSMQEKRGYTKSASRVHMSLHSNRAHTEVGQSETRAGCLTLGRALVTAMTSFIVLTLRSDHLLRSLSYLLTVRVSPIYLRAAKAEPRRHLRWFI